MQLTKTSFVRFLTQHDELPAFQAAYLAITVLIAGLLNLGAFALLIAAHMTIDVFKYRERHLQTWPRTIKGVLRENLTDIMLLLFGMVVSIYLNHASGIAAASGLLHAQETILRGLLLLGVKSQILFHTLTVFFNVPAYLDRIRVHPKKPWTSAEGYKIVMIAGCVTLLIIAPFILPMTAGTFAGIIHDQLVPWNI